MPPRSAAAAPVAHPGVRVAEALILACGVALRLLLAWRYDPRNGYDYSAHVDYLNWVARHHSLPPIAEFRTAYHPPLFYWLGGLLIRHGTPAPRLQWMSIAAGIASLAILFVMLRRHVRDAPSRLFALALAAVLPASLQLDSIVSNEPLNRLLGTIALALLPWAFDAARPHPALRGLVLGAALGLELLAKISALALVATVALGGLLILGELRTAASTRVRRVLVPATACAVALAVLAPLQLRALHQTGRLVASGFDGAPWGRTRLARLARTPYLYRRPFAFVAGAGGGAAIRRPWVVEGGAADPHFFPVLVASTFSDYYDFGFCRRPPPDEVPAARTPHGGISRRTASLMRASAAGGTVIALLTVAALAVALVAAARRRRPGIVLLLLAPIVAVGLQLHFAVAYPYDDQGPVKGLYMQFAAGPLVALAGLGFGWLWRRPSWRWLTILPLASLGAVALYSLHAIGLLGALGI
jgi:hypothetical protein